MRPTFHVCVALHVPKLCLERGLLRFQSGDLTLQSLPGLSEMLIFRDPAAKVYRQHQANGQDHRDHDLGAR